jgi:membrane protein implicated in regulation of membrane protease activity
MIRFLVALLVGAAAISAKRLGPNVLIFAFMYIHAHQNISFEGITASTDLSFFSVLALVGALSFIAGRTQLSIYSAKADLKGLPVLHAYVLRWFNKNNLFRAAISWKSRSLLEVCKNMCVLGILALVVGLFFGDLAIVIGLILCVSLMLAFVFTVYQQRKLKQPLSQTRYPKPAQTDIIADTAIVFSIVFAYLTIISSDDFLNNSLGLLLISRFTPCFRSILKQTVFLSITFLRESPFTATTHS